jgi:hypothetical protein
MEEGGIKATSSLSKFEKGYPSFFKSAKVLGRFLKLFLPKMVKVGLKMVK